MREKIASPYGGYESKGISFDPKDPLSKSMTQQHFAEDVEINAIVERFNRTGILGDPAAIDARRAVFGDFSNREEYHLVLNKLNLAVDAFMALPADVRSKFDNDPANVIEFLSKPENYEEAVKLGLLSESDLIKFKGVGDSKPAQEPAKPAEKAQGAPSAQGST